MMHRGVPAARRPFRVAGGFGLVELLVVIAIIAILAAILFPVFAQARERARAITCLSNLKQTGTALMMYVQDYDETNPPMRNLPDTGWRDNWADFNNPAYPGQTPNFLGSLSPYTKNDKIYGCPSAPNVTSGTPGNQAVTPVSRSSYLGNAVVMHRSIAAIPNPADIVYVQELFDARGMAFLRPRVNNGARTDYRWWYFPRPGQTDIWNYTEIHFKGGNVLFCDGHAKHLNVKFMRSKLFGLVDAAGNDRGVEPGAAYNQRWVPLF